MKTRRLALLLTASFVIATAAIAQEVPVRKSRRATFRRPPPT
jgi:hypothetical protein